MQPNIVAIAGEAGGANALAPVIDNLRRRSVLVQAYACREAVPTWKNRCLDCQELAEDLAASAIHDLLKSISPDLVLASTGVEKIDGAIHLEKQFVAVARAQSVPTLAVLDSWNNYVRRFYTPAGEPLYLPDRIAVMDERARSEMIAAGIDPDRLVITGHPHLNLLGRKASNFSKTDELKVRAELGIHPEQTVVLFASQPIAGLYGTGSAPDFPGYTEGEVLAGLVRELDEFSEEQQRDLVLVVRPHPRESVASYHDLKARQFRIIVSAAHDAHQLALAADLVMGMATMLLVEACYLGCTVISLQPGLKTPDTVVTNQAGLSTPVYRWAELRSALNTALNGTESKEQKRLALARRLNSDDAAQHVANVALQMCHERILAAN